jgi:hypothetical protein
VAFVKRHNATASAVLVVLVTPISRILPPKVADAKTDTAARTPDHVTVVPRPAIECLILASFPVYSCVDLAVSPTSP